MSVAEMGVSLFAANEGYLVDVEVNKVLDFESALLSYMHAEHGDFMEKANTEAGYDDEIIAYMKKAIENFKATQTF